MGYVIQAIYENGVLRPLQELDLSEHQQVQISVEPGSPANPSTNNEQDRPDPLEGVRSATGISDMAERFDDCRFCANTVC